MSVFSFISFLTIVRYKGPHKEAKDTSPDYTFLFTETNVCFFTKIKNKDLLNRILKEYIYRFGCWGHDIHLILVLVVQHQVRCCMLYPVCEVLWFPYIYYLSEQLQHILKEIKSGKIESKRYKVGGVSCIKVNCSLPLTASHRCSYLI